MDFIIFILIGAIAGWLAGRVLKGSGFGLLVNIIIGIMGGILGGWLYSKVSDGHGGNPNAIFDKELIFSIVYSAVGAMLVVFLAAAVKMRIKED